MLTRNLGRFGAAAVLAVGLLIASAVPASATVHNVDITASSTITIHNTTTSPSTNTSVIHTTGHATTNVCAPNSQPSTPFPVDFDSTGGGTIGASTTGWSDFPVGTNVFKARLVIVGGNVTLSATGGTINLTVRAEFYNCASTTLLCRTNNVNITLTGPNPTGTHHPTASTTFTVSGTSTAITVMAVPACNIIIRAAILNNVAIANLNLHVTT